MSESTKLIVRPKGTIQLYASELKQFDWFDEEAGVMVAGDSAEGIQLSETPDPRELVGTGSPEPKPVKAGSKWRFCTDAEGGDIVPSKRGGMFAFLVPVK